MEKPIRARSGFMRNGQTWAYYAVTLMNKLDNDTHLEPLIVLSEEAQQLKSTVIKLLQIITEKVKLHWFCILQHNEGKFLINA